MNLEKEDLYNSIYFHQTRTSKLLVPQSYEFFSFPVLHHSINRSCRLDLKGSSSPNLYSKQVQLQQVT